MSYSDQAALQQWMTHRDAQAFRSIVVRHSGMVYGTCRRVLGNAVEAEDLTQRCFEALVEARSVPGAHLGPWLHRVATNLCLKHIRSEKRRRTREATYAEEQRNSAEPVWDDVSRYVDEAIAELPERFQRPLVIHFLEGRSQAAISRESGVAPRTVGYRIEKGIELTRRSLRRRGITVPAGMLALMMGEHLARASSIPQALGAELGKIALSGGAGKVASLAIPVLGVGLNLKWASLVAGCLLILAGLGYVGLSLRGSSDAPVALPEKRVEQSALNRAPRPASAEQDPVEVVSRRAFSSAPVVAPSAEPTVDDAIYVRVVDAVTGKPLNLNILLTGEVINGKELDFPGNDEGRFRIAWEGLGYGTFTVSCRNYNYYPFLSKDGFRKRGEPVPEIVLRMKELPTISGRVLFADGTPAPETAVMREELGGNSDTLVHTDVTGAYAVHHDGGHWKLWAKKNMLWSESEVFDLGNDESVGHDFVLPPAGELTLLLQTTDGGEIYVVHTSTLMTRGVTMPFLRAERVGANRFLVRSLAFDDYRIELRAPGYEAQEVGGILINEANPSPTVRVTLKPARLYPLTMRVVDAAGQPVAEAGIALEMLGQRLDDSGAVQAGVRTPVPSNNKNTDENGEWTMEGLSEGVYRAYCNDVAGVGETTVAVPANEISILKLDRVSGLAYTLELVDALADDKPLSPVDAHRFVVHGDGSMGEGFAAGRNWIIAIKEGYTAYIDAPNIDPATAKEPISIRAILGEPGLVYGTLEGQGGTSRAYQNVYIYPADLWPLAQGKWSDEWKRLGHALAQGARTDAAGQFQLDYLPYGEYVVALSDTVFSDPVEVLPGMATGPIAVPW